MTAMAYFNYNIPYVLCQNLLLQMGTTYQLSFTVFNEFYVDYSIVNVLINGSSVLNHTTFGSINFTYPTVQIVPSSGSIQLCFNVAVFTSLPVGPYLDNITLTESNSSSGSVNVN